MSINNCLRNASVIFALLLTVSAPMATRADEPAAEPAAASDTKLVCRWDKKPGSHTKHKVCATAEQWRALRGPVRLPWGPSSSGALGYPPAPSIPGTNGLGMGPSQQR